VTFLRHGLFLLLLAASLMVRPARAQARNITGSDPQTTDSPLTPQQEDRSAPPSATEGDPLDLKSIVLALSDRGTIWLDELVGNGLLYGVSTSQGYGWTRSGMLGDSAGSLFVVQPYVGLFRGGHRTKILFQYLPTIDVYDGRQWGGGAFHRATVDGNYMLTQRLAWNFSGLTTYGKESLRQIAGLALAGGSGTAGWLTFASSPSDSLLVASAATGLNWNRTPRQELAFTITNSYGSASHSGEHYAVSVRAEIKNKVWRQATWNTYAQAHDYTSQRGCVMYGVGTGFSAPLGQKTSFGIESGPQFGGSGCGNRLSAAFAGFLQSRLSSRTTAYLSAKRELFLPYLVGNSWADNFSMRLKQETSRTTFVDASAAYVHSSNAGSTQRYQAYLLSSEFHWRATDTLSLIGSYRYFRRDTTIAGLQDRHSWIFCTVQWQPTSRNLHR
jgi:hypothetical protein